MHEVPEKRNRMQMGLEDERYQQELHPLQKSKEGMRPEAPTFGEACSGQILKVGIGKNSVAFVLITDPKE